MQHHKESKRTAQKSRQKSSAQKVLMMFMLFSLTLIGVKSKISSIFLWRKGRQRSSNSSRKKMKRRKKKMNCSQNRFGTCNRCFLRGLYLKISIGKDLG